MLLDSIQILGKKSKYQGLIDPEQMQWIEEDLAGLSRDTPIILVYLVINSVTYKFSRILRTCYARCGGNSLD